MIFCHRCLLAPALVALVASPAAALPPVTTGLQAQFVADDVVPSGGLVPTWTESFAGGITASQGTTSRQPALVAGVLNGHDVVRFDGVDDWLTLSSNLFSAASLPKTVFAVVRTSDVDGHVLGTGSLSSGFLPSYGSALVVVRNNFMFKANSNSAGLELFAPEFVLDGGWQIVVATVSSGASRIETLCSVLESSAATNPYPYGTSFIGATSGNDPLDGDIAELLVYDRVLTPGEIDSVRDDLAATYGLSVPDRTDTDDDGTVDDCDVGGGYLNDAQISVTDFSPPAIASLVGNAIDAPTVLSSDFHTQSTHVYIDADITLELDLGADYDLAYVHFWNYTTEFYDADDVSLVFRDAQGDEVASFDFQPTTAQDPIYGQDFALSGVFGVRTVDVLVTGTNSQTDFQNIGFTGSRSAAVPALGPWAQGLLALLVGAGGWRLRQRRRSHRTWSSPSSSWARR